MRVANSYSKKVCEYMKLSERVRYTLYSTATKLASLLPWWMLRGLAVGLGHILYRVIGYRNSVVEGNLSSSFPKLSTAEVKSLAQEFYRRFIFQFISSAKLLSLPEQELRAKHLKLEGLELFESLSQEGHHHTILLMGHCGNWELFSAGAIYFAPMGIQQEQLYRPMRDLAMDRLLCRERTKFGSSVLPKSDVGRRMLSVLKDEEHPPMIWAFIADQTPSRAHADYWTLFLNQPTTFLDGAERLARKLNLPVVYMDIQYISDTQYIGRMQLITSTPQACQPYEITETYVQLLEQTIRNNPAGWLWSHKRWKHTWKDYPEAVRSKRLTDFIAQQSHDPRD